MMQRFLECNINKTSIFILGRAFFKKIKNVNIIIRSDMWMTIIIYLVIITRIPPTLTNNSFRMGPKCPNSTPMFGKISTPGVTQGDRGRGQAGQGQAGEHPVVFIQTQRSGRQGAS